MANKKMPLLLLKPSKMVSEQFIGHIWVVFCLCWLNSADLRPLLVPHFKVPFLSLDEIKLIF